MININKNPKKPNVINLGCRLNAYQSAVLKKISDKNKLNDVIFVNTCCVTQAAEKQSRSAIRKAKIENPDIKIIPTGCAVQINPDSFIKMKEVHGVLGNAFKDNENAIKQVVLKSKKEIGKTYISDFKTLTKSKKIEIISFLENKTKGFIEIQNGCDHRCTFCIIPYGRGDSKSIPSRYIVEEILKMMESGYKEICLTGVDITSYGKNLDCCKNLGQLVKKIIKQTKISRVRLPSIDVAEIDDDLMDCIHLNKGLMPHFHLSLQSGDAMILKRMKRRHSPEMIYDFCKKIKKLRPNVTFGSDIICGFPTETDDMFNNTINVLKENNICFNHVFSYSKRDGTPAIKMPQVNHSTIKERTKYLINFSRQMQRKLLMFYINTNQKVLFENSLSGKTENYISFELEGPNIKNDLHNKIMDVFITKIIDNKLIGKLIN